MTIEPEAEAVEVPSAEVAQEMDAAADAVTEAASSAADEGNDDLATRLNSVATELRGHLQHHSYTDGAAIGTGVEQEAVTPVADEAVTAEAVVKPKKLHWFQRTRFL